MCTHYETQFSATVGGQRLTFDVRPHYHGGHIVALFNHDFPTLPIVFHTPNTDTLDEAVTAAEGLRDAYGAERLVAALVSWRTKYDARNVAMRGYRAGEGIFDVA